MLEAIRLLRDRAKNTNAKIVLPEGDDERVIQAAAYITKENIADIVLLGHCDNIKKALEKKNADIDKVKVVDFKKSPLLDKYVERFYSLRKHKGISKDDARNTILNNPVYFGASMVSDGLADGFVAGATNTTRDVARSAMWCLGLDKKIKIMSSSFIIILADKSLGSDGILIYADCAILPNPSSEQLANIAIASSDLMDILFKTKPKIAMLSFSTKGSGEAPEAEKIHSALKIVKKTRPDLLVDGELQADAALVPEVAKRKAPQSPLKGGANVLIFPNLEAGNISYKLTQRLARARAIGPLLNGLCAPCSDLSRGCSWDDIVDVVAVTVIRHAHNSKNK